MTDGVTCPVCGSRTRLRTSKRDGSKFHLCINYPGCQGKVVFGDEYEDIWDKGTVSRKGERRSDALSRDRILTVKEQRQKEARERAYSRQGQASYYDDTPRRPLYRQRTSGMAIASLVCGLTGVSLPAIILGVIGIKDTKKPGMDGRGMAVAGLILGILGTVFGIFYLIFIICITFYSV